MKLKKLVLTFVSITVALMLILSSCSSQATEAPPAEQPVQEQPPAEAPAPEQPSSDEPSSEEPVVEEPVTYDPVTIWTQLNTDTPASARDKIFAAMLPEMQSSTGITIMNVNQPYDQLDAKLNLAVQAGGEVPDIQEVNTNTFGFHYANGNLQDITDYVVSAPWYDHLSPGAINNCTGPDGRIYCVPAMLRTNIMYYYTESFPDGYPSTTDELLAAAPALKEQGLFAITGKVSEVWGAQFALFPLVKTFGGSFADKDGNIVWASNETVKVVEFLREIYSKGYSPESMAAAGFDSQTAFMNGTAASFIGGSWSYAFVNPIQTPSGQVFDEGAESVLKAMDAGVLAIAPPLSAPGSVPVSISDARAWGVPTSAKNVEGAYQVINYMMTPKPNADLAHTFGCVPTVEEALLDPRYADSAYWGSVIEILNKYSVPMDPITDYYDQIVLKFADTVVKLIITPNLDILSELDKAQKDMNNLN